MIDSQGKGIKSMANRDTEMQGIWVKVATLDTDTVANKMLGL